MNRISTVIVSGLAAAALASSTSALALPIGVAGDGAERAAPSLPYSPLALEDLDSAPPVDFTATLALNNCSGALVRFTGSQASDQAMALTNGHCYEGGFLKPGKVLQNEDSDRTFGLMKADGSGHLGTLHATMILYATMTDTDVTLYRLQESYEEIERTYNVKPLTIAATHPEVNAPIRVVSGYWKRIFSCNIDRFIYELHEGDWVFKDAIRYTADGCKVFGGTSGSPIIHAETHEVIGINNSINEHGGRCTLNNPCEVDEQGTVTITQGRGYGEEVYRFYSCLTAANEIDLSRDGCALPKPQ